MTLIRLSEDRSLQVAGGEPPLLQCDFCNDRGDRLGRIVDLVVDPERLRARFAIVAMAAGALRLQRVIIPLRDMIIDADAHRAIGIDCREETLRQYPSATREWWPGLLHRMANALRPFPVAVSREAPPPSTMPPETEPTNPADLAIEPNPLFRPDGLPRPQATAAPLLDLAGDRIDPGSGHDVAEPLNPQSPPSEPSERTIL